MESRLTPKGGKVSLGIAPPEIMNELARLKQFSKTVITLIPINTPEKAQLYRDALVEMYPGLNVTIPND